MPSDLCSPHPPTHPCADFFFLLPSSSPNNNNETSKAEKLFLFSPFHFALLFGTQNRHKNTPKALSFAQQTFFSFLFCAFSLDLKYFILLLHLPHKSCKFYSAFPQCQLRFRLFSFSTQCNCSISLLVCLKALQANEFKPRGKAKGRNKGKDVVVFVSFIQFAQHVTLSRLPTDH